MIKLDCDIAVLGSGFGGSLLAIIARRLGFTVALLERGTHPRFAIGESSTPLADFRLAAIANRFGLDWLRPFSKYGTWKARYPEIRCGLKRGFSFFRHEPGQIYTPRPANDNVLMVAASPDDARADTHWFRADFDANLVSRAVDAGVKYMDQCEIQQLHHDQSWRLTGQCRDDAVEVRAGFLVDATGDGQMLRRTLGLESVPDESLHARSRALYSHFTDVASWHDVLREEHGDWAIAGHPFPCDAAALHHIIDGGWMWVLRFEHGVTSAGFSLDPDAHPIRPNETPEAEWHRLLHAYPSLARQFRNAQAVRPFVRTGRLQRRLRQAAGEDWALLPHAAGFLDAWLSPGIAQTLFAVERLGRILAEDNRAPRLREYSQTVVHELAWMDEITGTCFASFDRFEVLTAVAMVYFVAAIHCEERERAGQAPPNAAFLLADNADFRRIAATIFTQAPHVNATDTARFSADVRRMLDPYHCAGLLDPQWRSLYPYLCST